MREENQADDELCALKTIITDGWPERQCSLPATLRPYWSCRDELSIEDSLIMKGGRLVIPSSMQILIVAKLHESHQGIENTRLRARATVYWKNINKAIDEIVKKCHVCQQMQRSHPHEPLMQHEIPTCPWQIVGTDFFCRKSRFLPNNLRLLLEVPVRVQDRGTSDERRSHKEDESGLR